jgi:hypothetical protein
MQQQFWNQRTDRQAREIIRAFCEHGAPFALYLRSFQQEAFDFLTRPTEVDPEGRLIGHIRGPSPLERKLAAPLQADVQTITAANPANLVWLDKELFPRIDLDLGSWETQIEWLAQAASFIVFELDALSPGVRRELDVLAKQGRDESTVIVLSSNGFEDDPTLSLVRDLHPGATFPDHERLHGSHPALQRFRWVVHEDQLPFQHLSEFPPFSELITAHDAHKQAELSAAMALRRGDLVHRWGLLQMGEEDIRGANQSFRSAVQLFVKAGNDLRAAEALMNLARTYLAGRRYDDAIAAFRDAGTLSKRAQDDAAFRNAVMWVGLAHYLSGDAATASHYLTTAVKLERGAGELGSLTLIDGLKVLCKIYDESGQVTSAQHCARDLAEAQRIFEQRQ